MYNVRFTLAVIIVTPLRQLLTDTEIKRNNYVHTKSPISRKTDKAVLPFFFSSAGEYQREWALSAYVLNGMNY